MTSETRDNAETAKNHHDIVSCEASTACECPQKLAKFEEWLDEKLESLEKRFAAFATHQSFRKSMGR